jgi:DNA polymerase-3 subunit delta
VSALKPAYLLHGDDEPKIDAWRSRMRTRAESEGGPGALESFDAKIHSPDEVAAALAMLTFGTDARYYLVDNAEAWKAGDLDPLEQALADPAPDTVLVMIARGKPQQRLVKAVTAGGGEAREYTAPKPWAMPKWAAERASECGLRLDQGAAKALVGIVGTRQQRLQREVEKLAIAAYPRTQLSAEEVEQLASGEVSTKAYSLADAVVAGDLPATMRLAEALTAGDERPAGLLYPIVRRLREVLRATELLEAGMSEKQIADALRVPSWKLKHTLTAAHKSDRDTLARSICVFADLERDLRGAGELDEETAFSLALARAAA